MKGKENIIKNSVIIINMILFFYLLFLGDNKYIYNMSYMMCILFMIFNFIFVYTYGMLKNEEKVYNTNIVLYILFFIYMLIAFTFIIGRPKVTFYTWWYKIQYKPFHTIIYQFKYGTLHSFLKNIIGNIIMLVPLSFFLIIKNDKFRKIKYQSLIILPIILLIETFQAITHTGTFDVDDIFLNYLGVVIFVLIFRKFASRMREIFYTDFKLKYKTKSMLFYISLILLIIFDIVIFIK